MCARDLVQIVERLLENPGFTTNSIIQQAIIKTLYFNCRGDVIELLMRHGMWFEPSSTECTNNRVHDEYKNARIKWYAERAERFWELHDELVAVVAAADSVTYQHVPQIR